MTISWSFRCERCADRDDDDDEVGTVCVIWSVTF